MLTKLDLPHSDPSTVLERLEATFGFDEDDVTLPVPLCLVAATCFFVVLAAAS